MSKVEQGESRDERWLRCPACRKKAFQRYEIYGDRLKCPKCGEWRDISEYMEAAAASLPESQLLSALRDANEVCRSAYEIAARMGRDTNWDAWIRQLEKTLKLHHEILYPSDVNVAGNSTGERVMDQAAADRVQQIRELLQACEWLDLSDDAVGKMWKRLFEFGLHNEHASLLAQAPLNLKWLLSQLSAYEERVRELEQSQPAPEMDYEDECPAWEVALNDMRVRFPKGNELELLASEYLRLREAELAHDARVQPSSVAGTMPVAVKKMRDACHADVLELIQRIIDASMPGTPATLSMQSLHESLSEGIDGFGDDSYLDNKAESALKESSHGKH